MFWAINMRPTTSHGKKKKHVTKCYTAGYRTKYWSEYLQKIDHLGDLDTDEIIFKQFSDI
jgi:hypothetical protein